MIIYVKDAFGDKLAVKPKTALYIVQDFMGRPMPGLAITMDEVAGEYAGTSYGTLTVSFGKFIGMKNCAYIDTNNCIFADAFLEKGYAKDTGIRIQSGFCIYPLWMFDETFLKEIDDETGAYAEYCKYMDAYQAGKPLNFNPRSR